MASVSNILITGTSKGIGFETALACGRAGHAVFATMRNPAQSTLGQAAAQENLPIHISIMDVNSDSSVSEGIAAILSTHGSIDVLVNNAGIERMGSIEEAPLADFRAVMETNYFGVLRCTQALASHMRQRKSGCIINISSVAGRLACAPMAAYTASKFALEALTEALACEMKAFNVRVALVEPGIIDTDMARSIGTKDTNSHYPHLARFSAMFTNALNTPTPSSLVAQSILDIAQGDTWQLRHPVGPDALPFLAWRATMTDEEWVTLNTGPDETFFAALAAAFGPS